VAREGGEESVPLGTKRGSSLGDIGHVKGDDNESNRQKEIERGEEARTPRGTGEP